MKIMYYGKGLSKISAFFVRNASSKPSGNLSILYKPLTINFLKHVLGLSTARCAKILEENEKLLDVHRKDIISTVDFLKSLKYTAQDIEMKPMILYINSLTLENRYRALEECGCKPISLSTLFKYVTVMNKEVSVLKCHRILPHDADVKYHLEQSFASDIDVKLNEKLNEELLLRIFREKVLNVYLMEKLNITKSQLEKQWKIYGRIRHKSFKSIIEMINILIKELNFPLDRIVKNGYLIAGDPENLRKLIKGIPEIGSENFKDILYRRPKIIMSSYESVHNTIGHIKKFGISDIAILKCLEILTLGSNTVLERLNDIKNVSELQALLSNPRILRIVHYQNKALQRLEYLNNMKVKCASLHILSCDSDAFIRFAREGTDCNKGKDVVMYLTSIFNIKEREIRNELSKHPNWCHIPVLQVKNCLELLQGKQFSLSDIFHNIHVLLYPKQKIEEKLNILYSDEFYKEAQLETNYAYVSYKNILTLCLYLLELEFHFTGDGIWTDHHTHNVENFNNLIPDFLENNRKVYKYGGKPSDSRIQSEAVV